jgi:hypothetical protein
MQDKISPGLTRFIDTLNPEDRECLVGALRNSETYIAENFDDVIAILRQLSK